MLVGLDKVLNIAEKGGFAIPAFNVYNMETVMGIIEAAEQAQAPVILQSYSRLFTEGEAYYLAPVIKAAAEKASVPVAFHLDHGAGEREVTRAIRYGCTGIMIDCSTLELEQNIEGTKKIVDMCSHIGIAVEGELGHIGSVNDDKMSAYTDVEEAKTFVQKTGVGALAVMVGTAHGHYKQAPVLDIERIADIKKATGIPLVLHGGSGVPDDQIKAAVAAGIRKINFGTDVCCSFLNKVFDTSRDIVAIDLFMKDAVQNIKKFGLEKIKLLGAKL